MKSIITTTAFVVAMLPGAAFAYSADQFTAAAPSLRTPLEELGTVSSVRATARRGVGIRRERGTRLSNRCERQYLAGTVELCLPGDWQPIMMPSKTESVSDRRIVGAFVTGDTVGGFQPTLTVVRDDTPVKGLRSAYVWKRSRALKNDPSYSKELLGVKLRIDGQVAALQVFEGDQNDSLNRFYHMVTVHNGLGYVIAATVPAQVAPDIHNEIMEIMKSVQFKKTLR